ncbi:flavodoxin family protein [Clostridium sp. DL1XJH146]
MGKKLIVYYSKSGSTKKVAEILAEQLDGDIVKIIDNKNRNGLFGFIFSGRDAIKEKMADIKEISVDLKKYDNIIVGTPVWASKLSTPALTFLRKYKDDISDYSLFYTQGGDGDNKIKAQLENYMDKKPNNIVAIYGKDFKDGNYVEKIKNI